MWKRRPLLHLQELRNHIVKRRTGCQMHRAVQNPVALAPLHRMGCNRQSNSQTKSSTITQRTRILWWWNLPLASHMLMTYSTSLIFSRTRNSPSVRPRCFSRLSACVPFDAGTYYVIPRQRPVLVECGRGERRSRVAMLGHTRCCHHQSPLSVAL